MKNYKQLILGIVIGTTATISISAIADYTYNVNPNTYPVLVDGQTTNIEGYNINDNTYFKLRDIGDKVGFRVDFANNMILVNTAPLPTATPTPTVAPVSVPLPELEIQKRGDVQYVSKYDIEDMLKSIGLGQYTFAGRNFYLESDSLNPILKDIPLYEKGIDLIPLDYYTSTIVPVINSLR